MRMRRRCRSGARAEPDRRSDSGGGRKFSPRLCRRGAERVSVAIGGAGSGAVFEPPARVAGFDDIAMMRQPVEHGCGHFGVPDQLRIPPLSMDWCPKCGLSLGAMGCLAKSFRSWG